MKELHKHTAARAAIPQGGIFAGTISRVSSSFANTDGFPAARAHGGDGEALALWLGLDVASVLDLSQTLNPFAFGRHDLFAKALSAVNRYPDVARLREVFSGLLGVNAENLLITNGGSEAIWLTRQLVGGSAFCEPDFALYPRSQTTSKASGPYWRSDPHSPSGFLAPQQKAPMSSAETFKETEVVGVGSVEQEPVNISLAQAETVGVWDEAFYAMATGRWSAKRWRQNPNTITIGSFTKLFACPGLRLGYVVSNKAERLKALQPQWPVSSVAVEYVLGCLEKMTPATLQQWAKEIEAQKKEMSELFKDAGYSTIVNHAPWLLVKGPKLRFELGKQGILVRDCANFNMAGWVRIAVCDSEGLLRLRRAIGSISS